jgi:error-prone DNA polymerase
MPSLFKQVKGFGGNGFPESHPASFALLYYVSYWLRCHHPAAFYCTLLNIQLIVFYSSSQLINLRHKGFVRVAGLVTGYQRQWRFVSNTGS